MYARKQRLQLCVLCGWDSPTPVMTTLPQSKCKENPNPQQVVTMYCNPQVMTPPLTLPACWRREEPAVTVYRIIHSGDDPPPPTANIVGMLWWFQRCGPRPPPPPALLYILSVSPAPSIYLENQWRWEEKRDSWMSAATAAVHAQSSRGHRGVHLCAKRWKKDELVEKRTN